ncbi:bifunctional folylpolyglutamate synthase/dihydrofolate synthase [Niallia sp. Krafla_26]|uniref:bifunctional folylpolyglutamate synthase/dihydrofolate synthase n=1 Tax=Niallia sp. Krafla_26 TaxID=3064703 RepID=UPI003D182BBB
MTIKTMKEAEDLIYQSYLRAINHINETKDAKVKKPELTRELFDHLGSPDQNQKFILVTGSKGKGSTSRFISSLLSHLGFKVGLFTSPHLVRFNERIRIDGKAISDEDFVRLSNRLVEPFQMIESELKSNEYQGPIGLALAIAIMYFKENQTDINIIECGRGGLYDDTNILQNEWAVITPIMEEHLINLGPTIDDVIDHKLDIIKNETKFVYLSEQHEHLPKVLGKIHEWGLNQLSTYGKDFIAKNIAISARGTIFDIETSNHTYCNLKLPLLGSFQAINVATAVKLCEDILGESIDTSILKECYGRIQWPGRCEIIDQHPTVIVDGAINEKSARYIEEVVRKINCNHVVSVVGVPENKDYKGVIRVVSEFSQKIIVTKPDISHLVFPEDGGKVAKSFLTNSVEAPILAEAIQLAKQEQGVDTILIIGTQTLIANAKRLWNQDLMDIGK